MKYVVSLVGLYFIWHWGRARIYKSKDDGSFEFIVNTFVLVGYCIIWVIYFAGGKV